MTTTAGPQPEALPSLRSDLGLLQWVATVDHKQIGILYMATALIFFLIGGLEALLIRIQLAQPGQTLLSPSAYNQMFTMHGTTMIFLFAMPMLVGAANYLVPLMIGARDVAFPRVNALSFWLLLSGGLLLYYSFIGGGAPDTGWFSYAPLTEHPFSMGVNTDYWILGILVTGLGSIAGALNLMVTIINLRAPGMTIGRLPLFVWMVLVTMFLILATLPTLSADVIMLLMDRRFGAHFFDAGANGQALLWQHLFWWFGHPEVYILILPAFGIISEVIPVFSRKPIFSYGSVAAATVAIAFLSFGVWAHHMFTVGLGETANALFGADSMLIAIPTGIKIFNWLATMWRGAIRLTTSMWFAIGFLATFVIGGLSGVSLAVVPVDWQVEDSYYLVAHFHYVLFGGTVMAIFAGVYYWFPKVSGRLLSERLGSWHFWLMLIGFNVTFFPMHFLGLLGMSRRVYTYPSDRGWGDLNLLSTMGTLLLTISVLVFVWNILQSARNGKPAGDNPWQAWGLEWATTSPPPPYNFATVPEVHSRRPLWDVMHPDQKDETYTQRILGRDRAAAPNTHTLGMGIFAASESLFFIPLILIYVIYRGQNVSGPDARQALDVGRTAIFTVCLLASSVTIALAARRLRAGDIAGMRVLLLLTALLGAIFLVGQGIEYRSLYLQHVEPSRNLFGSTFFTLTGFHGLHVLAGVIAILVVVATAFAGDMRGKRDSAALEVVSIFWHFVDGVWVVIFGTVYLWALFQ